MGNREDACKEEVPQIRRGDLLRGFMQKAATCQWSTCHACKSKADAARIGLRATHLANFYDLDVHFHSIRSNLAPLE